MVARIVAFDIGDKRIGVAFSAPFGDFAMPSETYFRTGNFKADIEAVVRIAEREATEIVCGLPFNADGTESVQTEKTRRFIEALKGATVLPVYTVDERNTTMEARQDLIHAGVSTKKDKHKKQIDSLAATYILERYLQIRKGENTMSMKEEANDYEGEDNIVELVDEDGTTLRYEHVGTIEYKGEWYCFLTPEKTERNAEEDEGDEVAVFRIVGDEDNETLETIEDDELLDEVFAEFCNQYDYAEDADEAYELDAETDIND